MAEGTLMNKVVVEVAEIVHHGDKLILPMSMSIDTAIDLLIRRKHFLEEKCVLAETFDAFPYDGANALNEVLTERYGWAASEPTPGRWGPTPPQLINIDVGVNKVKQVPWGSFSIPGVAGLLTSDVRRNNAGRLIFSLAAEIRRRDEPTVKEVFNDLRKYLRQHSLYRGQAIKIRFKDEAGDTLELPEPKFLDTNIDESTLIYSQDVQDMIETSLFTPITRVRDLIDNGIQVKRGVLLGGTYGTGKTLAAKVASKLAVAAGVTYVYVQRADELREALEFAKQYQSPACVVFCEDIDRVMSGERSVEMDDILNIIDGIDSKNAHIIVVLTTNNLDEINPAMLRPGRLDAVIEVTPPDAQAVQKLIHVYGRGSLEDNIDLTQAGALLDGQIPAVIAEVVKRAKRAQLRLQPPGTRVERISAEAICVSAKTIQQQVALLNDNDVRNEPPSLDSALKTVVKQAVEEANA